MKMQEKILNLLAKKKKPMRRTEIAEALNTTPTHISARIRQLLKFHEVKCIELDRNRALEVYGCQRRMRLYYVD